MSYDLAEIAPPPRGRKTATLPIIEGSLRAEQAYLKILRQMLQGLADIVKSDVVPEAQREARRMFDAWNQGHLLADAMPDAVWAQMRAIAMSLASIASRMVERVLSLESQRHTEKFMTSARKSLGVDLRAVVRQQDLNDLLAAVAVRNAALITDIAQETVAKVATTTVQSVLSGAGAKALKRELRGIFEFSDSRAKLIAQDQTAKLNSDLNRFRQGQAGIDRYVWRTSRDERVRPRHRALDGRVYRWGEATGAEGGAPPGQPIRCRCVAQALVEF